MERLCISSFLQNGHGFHLYVYQDIEGVPDGTVLMDGNKILPASRIFMYRECATYAGFANFFRYKLLLEEGGWFVDTDTVCLKPFDFVEDYVFSSQGQGESEMVNVAAIKVPRGSPAMQFAWDACQRMDPDELRWGQCGPNLITRAVEQYSLKHFVKPPEAFCPVAYPDWERVLDPQLVPELGPESYAIHLWNEMWRRSAKSKDRQWDSHCLYEQLKQRYLAPCRSKPAQATSHARSAAQLPLKGLRIAATVPPPDWFGGVDHDFALDMCDELIELGANVFQVPIDPFVARRDAEVTAATDALRSFQPDVALSLANAGHAVLCTTRDGQNVFRDVLEIPTLMLWDHGPLQFPRILLQPTESTSDTPPNCIRQLRRALDHPLYIHYSPDRAHIAEFDRLGILDSDCVQFFQQPAYPSYVRHGLSTRLGEAFGPQIAFFGNVYLRGADEVAFRRHPELCAIEARVFAAWRERITSSLWDLTVAEIEKLSPTTRDQLGLRPQSAGFWAFLYDMVQVVGNTRARLEILSQLHRTCDFFGNFVEPESITLLQQRNRIRYRESVNCVTGLPSLFASCGVTVDIVNLGYSSGASPKQMAVLAAGGLPLFDFKSDFRESLGEAADQIMYRSVDELNGMIELYLANPRKRLAVIRELQTRALTEFSFGALAKRILVDEPLWRNIASGSVRSRTARVGVADPKLES